MQKVHSELVLEASKTEFEIFEGVDHQNASISSSPHQISYSKLWRSIRLAFRILILLVLVGLLAFIIAVIVVHPGCKKTPELKWWEKSNIYRVDLTKFNRQSGLSSFKTLLNNLAYFEARSVDVIWLSDVVDLDVDFKTINSDYGTLDELKELIVACENKGIKVFIDFIPNHTSTSSDWFKKSLSGNPQYKDYYVWVESDNLPNNWQSTSNQGSAWTLAAAKKYYLSQFKPTADLNYRNPNVFDELVSAVEFWLSVGIRGFNMVHASFIYEDYLLRDEEIINPSEALTYDNLKHDYTRDQRETFNFIAEIKSRLAKFSTINELKEEIVLIVELDSNTTPSNRAKYFGNKYLSGADLVIYEKLFETGTINGRNFLSQLNLVSQEYKQYDRQPVWIIDDVLSNSAQTAYRQLQAGITLLPGTTILQADNTIHETMDKINLITEVSGYKSKIETFQFGEFKYEEKTDLCGFVQYQRFFDGQNTYSVHFDLDSRNCTNQKYSLSSSQITGATPDVQLINTEFVDSGDDISSLSELESIKFDSKGNTKIELPRNSFLVLTWKFAPPDIKDIL